MKPGPYLLKGLLGVGAIVAVGVLVAESPGRTVVAPDADRFDASVFIGGRDLRTNSQSFRGGEVHSVIGAIDVDLRDAAMEGDEAVIELHVVLGALELRVPEDWVVDISDVDSLVAGVENRTNSVPSEDPQRLVLRGAVLMGALEIRN